MLQLLVILRICCAPLPWMPSCPLEVSSCKQDDPCQWGGGGSHNLRQKYSVSRVVAETLKTIFERDIICSMGSEGASLGASLRFLRWVMPGPKRDCGLSLSSADYCLKLSSGSWISEGTGTGSRKQVRIPWSKSLSPFWPLSSWKLCPTDSLGFMFTWNISRRFHRDKIIFVLKWLKKEGVSHFASYLGATPLPPHWKGTQWHQETPKISAVRTRFCCFSHNPL